MSHQRRLAPISISEEGQHDDHCRLTFMGENWWISAVRMPLIILTNENGRSVLDVSHVDWPAYLAAAEGMMRNREPISEVRFSC